MPNMLGWLHRGSDDTANTANTADNTNTTPADVLRRLSEGEELYLLDVREPAEYREAHVPGSNLVPLGQLAYKLEELPRDLSIVAVCRSGNRSGVAVSMLRRAGYTKVQNLQGGIIAWIRVGGPTHRGK